MSESQAPTVATNAGAPSAATEGDLLPTESEGEESFADDGEEEDEEDEGDVEDRDDDEESVTGASELEEEAQYENQPACGLPPSLVVRRGCEVLTADDPIPTLDGPGPSSSSSTNGPTPLSRVDTFSSFAQAVGRAESFGPMPSPSTASSKFAAPPLERMESMPPEVKEAFAAVSALEGSSGGGSSSGNGMAPPPNTPMPTCDPMPVRRTDTMELLADPTSAEDSVEPQSRPAKRAKPAA